MTDIGEEARMSSVQFIARDAVSEWLEDGMEFCYIYERDDAAALSNGELNEVKKLADEIVAQLAREFLARCD